MSKNAKQIVASMLEDFEGSVGAPAGSPHDPWRQGGSYKQFNPDVMDITGRRPGEPLAAPGDAEELSPEERAKLDADNAAAAGGAPGAAPAPSAPPPPMQSPHLKSRFTWKAPGA